MQTYVSFRIKNAQKNDIIFIIIIKGDTLCTRFKIGNMYSS